jgi:TatD DNase family protein
VVVSLFWAVYLADGVDTLICVGTDVRSSEQAVTFASLHHNCYASLAIHPHEVASGSDETLAKGLLRLDELLNIARTKIVAIGECGLDYFYHQDEEIRRRQQELLRQHLQLAKKYDLPVIFHIRDAFNDFFDILDEYAEIKGVVHSFSAGVNELEGVLKRGLFVGLNGIMTFSKQKDQLQAAKMVPLEKMVLETDAPFLTPAPFRGTMCKPKHLRITASFLSDLRSESLEDIARATTQNAEALFGL